MKEGPDEKVYASVAMMMKRWMFAALCVAWMAPVAQAEEKEIRIGIIGLDTSHATAFTKVLNQGPKNPADAPKFAGLKVVAAYPQGSKDIPGSYERVPEYTEAVKKMGVEIVDSIDALLPKVDAILLESNDGKVHLEQLQPLLKVKKPVFIDKPLAASLPDCIRILNEAAASGTPVFTSSALRFGANTIAVRGGSIGTVSHAETYSPAKTEPSHPDLFWYGIHGVESLFTAMGRGAVSVKRGTTADGLMEVTGEWSGGRAGVFREANTTDRKGYGGKAKGDKGEAAIGTYDGYEPLLVEIATFFRSGKPPVSAEESLEIYAFMEASDESKRRGGAVVTIAEVMAKARIEAAK